MNRREFLLAGAGAGMVASLNGVAAAEPLPKTGLGLLFYSYAIRAKVEKDQGFADPIRFLEFAQQRGVSSVQLSLGIRTTPEAMAIRQACDRLQMGLEAIVSPPKDSMSDLDRFSAELSTARECGVEVVRTVMLGGRRYEVFDKATDYEAFVKGAAQSLERADPVARKQKIILAVENHKDYRVDEMIDLMKRFSSEWIGLTLDTGNNLALLDDPISAVEALAPWTRTVHLKDIGVEESRDGFRMAEVPLGRGCFELRRMIAAVRRANPKARFHLEMITRDPLSIPCLTEKYWATFQNVPGRDLARTLKQVREVGKPNSLPRITSLPVDEQVAAEERHVRESFDYWKGLSDAG